MLTAHRVADVRAAEDRVFAGSGGDDGTLMARAARAVADHVLAVAPGADAIAVLVGPGNNGGDALFAAAHLADAGRRVALCLLSDRVHAAGLAAAEAAGARREQSPAGFRVVVDGVFGIGARPGLEGMAAQWASAVRDAFVVAVDVPSGIDVDGGTLPDVAIRADHTVALGTAKIGLLAGPAAALAGQVTVADIGLAPGAPALEALEDLDGPAFAQVVPGPTDHKYSRGVVGVHAGSDEYAGAAHLAVAGAQTGPAGMVRFAGTADLSRRVVDRAPEVVAAPGRVQAWVIGPGGAADPEVVEAVLAEQVPLVADATALDRLPARFAVDALLTPHAGELARMLGVTRDEVEADPIAHAVRAASAWNATVLLKGARTLVAAPDGRLRVNTSGTPWLGTAGAGDVLAGLAGSLLAAGLDAFDAGSVAAFVHGRSADVLGDAPFVARDLVTVLPGVLGDFLAGSVRGGAA